MFKLLTITALIASATLAPAATGENSVAQTVAPQNITISMGTSSGGSTL